VQQSAEELSTSAPWFAVAIFAHDEERHVERALHSVLTEASPAFPARVWVLTNGCSDRTLPLVRTIARANTCVVPVTIPLADKSNAWNVYVHHLAPRAAAWHVFMDGDGWCVPGVFERLAALLGRPERREAVAGVPARGRNRLRYTALARRGDYLHGGFYALRGELLERVRVAGLRLPVGAIGDDFLVARLIGRVATAELGSPQRAVHTEPGVAFDFEPLQPWKWRHVRAQIRRRVRHRLRAYQLALLADTGPRGWPATTREIDGNIARMLEQRTWPGLTDGLVLRLARRRSSWLQVLDGQPLGERERHDVG